MARSRIDLARSLAIWDKRGEKDNSDRLYAYAV